jgi:hypothetical protein
MPDGTEAYTPASSTGGEHAPTEELLGHGQVEANHVDRIVVQPDEVVRALDLGQGQGRAKQLAQAAGAQGIVEQGTEMIELGPRHPLIQEEPGMGRHRRAEVDREADQGRRLEFVDHAIGGRVRPEQHGGHPERLAQIALARRERAAQPPVVKVDIRFVDCGPQADRVAERFDHAANVTRKARHDLVALPDRGAVLREPGRVNEVMERDQGLEPTLA